MADVQEQELIADYSVLNEQNLVVALKVRFAFDAIWARIIADFLEKCAAQLRSSLGTGWIVEPCVADAVLNPGRKITVKRQCWKPQLKTILGTESKGLTNAYFSVAGDLGGCPQMSRGELKAAIDRAFAPGTQYEVSHWYKLAKPSLRDWNNEKTLLELRYRDMTAAYFAETLAGIAKTVDALVEGSDELSPPTS